MNAPPFAQPAEAVLAEFGVDPATGLSEAKVAEQRAKYGKNGTTTPHAPLHHQVFAYADTPHSHS